MSTSPHITRYFARVDSYLPSLIDDAARQAFLASETAKWTERYEQYQAKVDAGRPTDPAVSAFDYVETLVGLAQRSASACHEQLIAAE